MTHTQYRVVKRLFFVGICDQPASEIRGNNVQPFLYLLVCLLFQIEENVTGASWSEYVNKEI